MRRLVRFTVTTANIGDADINIGDPLAHYDANDGLFELATCHQHFHFRNYALYELIDPRTGKIWKAAKAGFCMLDTDPNPASLGGTRRAPKYRSCGTLTQPGNQGITHGWSDTYRFFLGGQYFVLDGGDGQPPVPPGDYIIRDHRQPGLQGEPQEPVPRARPGHRPLPQLRRVELHEQRRRGADHHSDPPRPRRRRSLAGTEPLKTEPTEHWS